MSRKLSIREGLRVFNFVLVPNPESRFQRETPSKIPSEAKRERGTCERLRREIQ